MDNLELEAQQVQADVGYLECRWRTMQKTLVIGGDVYGGVQQRHRLGRERWSEWRFFWFDPERKGWFAIGTAKRFGKAAVERLLTGKEK